MEPLSSLINRKLLLPSQRTNYMAVELTYLTQVLRPLIDRVFVDESWYTTRYPDVIPAIGEGKIEDASEHYALHGYYEHRMPYKIEIDEKWYLSQYDDIIKAVAAGIFASGQVHFDECGYREGRMPFPHFRLRLRSDQVKTAMPALVAHTAGSGMG
jgi:hypothetical protein